jgi:hypothetical protein
VTLQHDHSTSQPGTGLPPASPAAPMAPAPADTAHPVRGVAEEPLRPARDQLEQQPVDAADRLGAGPTQLVAAVACAHTIARTPDDEWTSHPQLTGILNLGRLQPIWR